MMDKKMKAQLREAKISDLGPIIQLIQDVFSCKILHNLFSYNQKWIGIQKE